MDEFCDVCKTTVEETAKVAICPSCDAVFHFNHLKQWINRKKICPNCRTHFSWTFINYFKADTSTEFQIPQRYQSVAQIRHRQSENISRFSGPVDISDITDRVEESKCIVCGEDESGLGWGSYTYCGYSHYERVNPWVLSIPLVLATIVAMTLITANSQLLPGVLTVYIPFVIYLGFRYFTVSKEGEDIRMMLNSYEKSDSLFTQVMFGLLGLLLFVLYLFVRFYDRFGRPIW